MGKLWGFFCEYFWENWLRYNGTALYQNMLSSLISDQNSVTGDDKATLCCINQVFIKQCEVKHEQGKSEGFDNCDRTSNLTQIGFKSLIFLHVLPWNLMDNLKKH